MEVHYVESSRKSLYRKAPNIERERESSWKITVQEKKKKKHYIYIYIENVNGKSLYRKSTVKKENQYY